MPANFAALLFRVLRLTRIGHIDARASFSPLGRSEVKSRPQRFVSLRRKHRENNATSMALTPILRPPPGSPE